MELVQCKPVYVAHFTVSVLFSEQVFFSTPTFQSNQSIYKEIFDYSLLSVVMQTGPLLAPKSDLHPIYQ